MPHVLVVVALIALLAPLPACGSSDGDGAPATGTPAAGASGGPATATAAGSGGAESSPVSGEAGSSSSASGGATGGEPEADVLTARAEAKEGALVLERFLSAVSARDVSAAGGLVAPDALFQVEDVTNRVAKIGLDSGSRLVPDEEGQPHLTLKGDASVRVVAANGSDLRSGQYTLAVRLRRESRRDEWRIWSFELTPR